MISAGAATDVINMRSIRDDACRSVIVAIPLGYNETGGIANLIDRAVVPAAATAYAMPPFGPARAHGVVLADVYLAVRWVWSHTRPQADPVMYSSDSLWALVGGVSDAVAPASGMSYARLQAL